MSGPIPPLPHVVHRDIYLYLYNIKEDEMGKASCTHSRVEKYTTLKWIWKMSSMTMDAIMNMQVPMIWCLA